MWQLSARDWPAIDEAVIGIDSRGDLAWWTRTADGWYRSSNPERGVGHRDQQGPTWWYYAPRG